MTEGIHAPRGGYVTVRVPLALQAPAAMPLPMLEATWRQLSTCSACMHPMLGELHAFQDGAEPDTGWFWVAFHGEYEASSGASDTEGDAMQAAMAAAIHRLVARQVVATNGAGREP